MVIPAGPAMGAFAGAFGGALVEGVEALTVVLAIGTVRGWRDTLAGAAAGVAVLAVLVAVLGPMLGALPEAALRLAVGLLILLFGVRWLRKAVERAAGRRPLHDEDAAFAQACAGYAGRGEGARFDRTAAGGAFNIVMLEGVEVVFIVAALGTSAALTRAAALGAALALALVLAAGLVLRRPIAALPENTMKLGVGVVLAAFGTFWVGEGLGAVWPGGDAALAGLLLLWGAATLLAIRLA